MKINEPKISIIIPTFNAYTHLRACLRSIKKQDYQNVEIVINEDKRTNDKTPHLIEKWRKNNLNIIYIKENKSMAQGRKRGVDFSSGKYLLHLDADMQITKKLLGECIYLINQGFDASVIPEESYGTTFWAKCKWLEKHCYNGIEEIESLRFVKRKIYKALGGHDERMVFSEDKDFDIRVREAGYRVGRTKNFIWHKEGKLTLIKTLKKKIFYSETANYFALAHPKEFRWQKNILIRYKIFFANIKYLFSYPLLYIGMIFMKTGEFIFGGIGYFYYKFIARKIKYIKVIITGISNFWILAIEQLFFNKNRLYKVRLKNGLNFYCRNKTADIKEIVTTILMKQYSLDHLKITKGGVVLDLGAHIGSFSIYLHLVRPDLIIYAIEPIKENYNLLSKNIFLNKAAKQIIPLNLAVSNFDGRGYFADYGDTDSYHLSSVRKGNYAKVRRLRTLLKETKINKIDFVKMDIEGEEYKVIQDSIGILKQCSEIQMEYHRIINSKMMYPDGERDLLKYMNRVGMKEKFRSDNVARFVK